MITMPETEAQRELESGETILWAGRPDAKQMGMQSIPIAIFGLFWTSFIVFWVCGAASMGSRMPNNPMGVVFPLFGLPFVLIGVAMIAAPFWAGKAAQSTTYAVTNHRILVIKASRNRSVRSFRAEDIGELEYTERPDGSGTLVFSRHNYQSGNGQTNVAKDQFIGIPNVRQVEQLVRDTFKNGQRPGGT
jgi:hypothetical protein